jgi:hypothetical protein
MEQLQHAARWKHLHNSQLLGTLIQALFLNALSSERSGTQDNQWEFSHPRVHFHSLWCKNEYTIAEDGNSIWQSEE